MKRILDKTSRALCVCLALAGLSVCSVSSYAQEAMKKEQCLACHGPTVEDLIHKNVRAQSDSGIVNPHVWIPHAGGPDKTFNECIDCHSQHPLPPAKGYKDQSVSLEPCYACHHNYQLKKCSSCHNS